MLLANLPPLAAAQCSLPSRRSALMSRSLAAVLYLAADTLASQRRLNLTIPFMAASTVELIAALNLPRKPDVLGWGGRACLCCYRRLGSLSAADPVAACSGAAADSTPTPLSPPALPLQP